MGAGARSSKSENIKKKESNQIPPTNTDETNGGDKTNENIESPTTTIIQQNNKDRNKESLLQRAKNKLK